MSFYSPSRNIFDHSCYRHDFPEEFMRCLLRYVFFYGIYTSFLLHVVLINLTVISLRCPASLSCPDTVQNTFTNIYEQCSISSFLFCSKNPLVLVQMVAPTPSLVLRLLCGWTRQNWKTDFLPMCRKRVDQFCKNVFTCKELSTFWGECLGCNATFTLDMAKDHVNNCLKWIWSAAIVTKKVKRVDTLLHSDRWVMKEVNCVCGTKVKQKDMNAYK